MAAKTINTKDPEIGSRYGRLTIVSGVVQEKGRRLFRALCDCGNVKLYDRSNLVRTKSCGCLRVEVSGTVNKVHGMRNKPIYHVWTTMIQRCTNTNHSQYKDYGGRGIEVCLEWRTFTNFLNDMGEAPFKGATLERANTNKGYNKENVYWASREIQANNTRKSVRFTYNGKELTLKQLSVESGVLLGTLRSRIYAQGLSVEEAISRPIMSQYEASKLAYNPNRGKSKGRVVGKTLYQ